MRKPLVAAAFAVLVAGAATGAAYLYFSRGADHYQSGIKAYQNGDFRRAQLELRNVIRDDRKNASAYYWLGLSDARAGNPAAAEKDFRSALNLGFDPVIAKPALAQAYLAQEKFKDLLADIPPVGSPPELAARLYLARGLAYLHLKDIARATESVDNAAKLAPRLAEVPLASAQIDFAQNDLVTAEHDVDVALDLDHKNVAALVFKAGLQDGRGDRAGALSTINLAISAMPENATARVMRAGYLLDSGDDRGAKTDIDHVLSAEPRNAMAIYLRAEIETRSKNWAAADALLTKLDPILGRIPKAIYYTALVKANLGQPEQALDAAARYHARVPDDPDGINLLARTELDAKHPTEAIKILADAIRAGLGDADTAQLLAQSYALAGQAERADAGTAAGGSPVHAPAVAQLVSAKAGARPDADAVNPATGQVAAHDLAPADDEKSTIGGAISQPTQGATAAEGSETAVRSALAAGDVSRADAALRKMRDQGGDTEVVDDLSGVIRMYQSDFDGAQNAFDAALRRYPKSVRIRLDLATLSNLRMRPADAERYLQEALSIAPANEAALGSLVSIYASSGRIGQAVALLESARKSAPGNAAFTAAIADLQSRSGDGHAALATLDRVPADQANLPALLGARARAEVAVADPTSARDTYTRILANNPDDLNARARLVELLLAAKNYGAAKDVVDEGLRRHPKNLGMMEALLKIEADAHGFDAAIALAARYGDDTAMQPESRVLKGDLYLGARRFDDAVNAFMAGFRAAPSSGLAMRLASAQIAAGHRDAAIQTLGGWVEGHRDDMQALKTLASLEVSDKRYDQAAVHFREILARSPNDVASLNNLSWIYGLAKDDRALALAQKAYVLSPTPEVMDTLGWILTTFGKPVEAAPYLGMASERVPGNQTFQYHYGIALRDSGKRDEAVGALTKAVAGSADYPERNDAQRALAELSTKQ
jgi:tetratricopeptide (TPR) repeat protein